MPGAESCHDFYDFCKGTWQPECFFANGSLETFTLPCTLNEYTAYVQAHRALEGKALPGV